MQFAVITDFDRKLHKEKIQVIDFPENVIREIVQSVIDNKDYAQRQQLVKRGTRVGESG